MWVWGVGVGQEQMEGKVQDWGFCLSLHAWLGIVLCVCVCKWGEVGVCEPVYVLPHLSICATRKRTKNALEVDPMQALCLGPYVPFLPITVL